MRSLRLASLLTIIILANVSLWRQGSHAARRTLKNLEFCDLLFHAWNLLKNSEKPGILTQNLEKKLVLCKFCFSRFTFQDVIFKKKSDLHLCHICIINTNTDSNQIDLGFHCIYLENTWNFLSPEKWEPCLF